MNKFLQKLNEVFGEGFYIAWSTENASKHTVGISADSYDDAVSLAMKGTSFGTDIVPAIKDSKEKQSKRDINNFMEYLDSLERKLKIRFDIIRGKEVPRFTTF